MKKNGLKRIEVFGLNDSKTLVELALLAGKSVYKWDILYINCGVSAFPNEKLQIVSLLLIYRFLWKHSDCDLGKRSVLIFGYGVLLRICKKS